MKVVLLTDVKSQGKKNDVIEVSDGYARNYLIPRKLAVEADSSVLNAIKGKEEALRHKIETETAEAKATAARLESLLDHTARRRGWGRSAGSCACPR